MLYMDSWNYFRMSTLIMYNLMGVNDERGKKKKILISIQYYNTFRYTFFFSSQNVTAL